MIFGKSLRTIFTAVSKSITRIIQNDRRYKQGTPTLMFFSSKIFYWYFFEDTRPSMRASSPVT